jgi:hypothetical protein
MPPPSLPPSWHATAVAAVYALDQRVFTYRDLRALLDDLRSGGTVPARTSLNALLEALTTDGDLQDTQILPVGVSGGTASATGAPRVPFQRYVWGTASPYEVALSLRPRSYLSHATAMVLHGLTSATDLPVYVNQEQSAKPTPRGQLHQAAIDRAFQNQPRTSQYRFRYGVTDIVLVSGKQTGNLGVETFSDVTGTRYPATHLERTLIDITVRPAYAGGVAAVLEAYRRALGRVSIPSLTDVLAKLGYVYPYHQAIGFYLERAGATSAETVPFRARRLKHDFYLAHQMEQSIRDERWQVYYPTGLF